MCNVQIVSTSWSLAIVDSSCVLCDIHADFLGVKWTVHMYCGKLTGLLIFLGVTARVYCVYSWPTRLVLYLTN